MQTKYKVLIGMAGVGAFGFYLYRFYKRQVDLLMDFETAFAGIEIKKASVDLVTLEILMRFRNKANIEATVDHVYGEVFLQEASVGFFNEVAPFVIPAKGESDIPVSVTFSPRRVIKNFTDFLLGVAKTKDMPVRVKGYATVRSGFVRISVPYEYTTTIKEYFLT